MLEGLEAMRLEPELLCVKALLSTCSGIVDSHSLMVALLVTLLISTIIVLQCSDPFLYHCSTIILYIAAFSLFPVYRPAFLGKYNGIINQCDFMCV